MTGFCGQPKFLQGFLHSFPGKQRSFPACRKQENVIGITEIVNTRNALDFSVHARQINVGENACTGASKGDAERSTMSPSLILIVKTNALGNEFEQIVIRRDVIL